MKNKISFQVKMLKPCREEWDMMKPEQYGRHCEKCQKTVVDMTEWAEPDFTNYFLNNPGNLCGRINEKQDHQIIEKEFLPPPKTTWRKSLYALSLSLFSLASFSSASAKVVQVSQSQQSISPQHGKDKISGQVTGIDGEFLKGVKVEYNGKSYFTDAEGRFQIEELSSLPNQILVFTYEGLNKQVRSYNRALGSTNIDVEMCKPVRCRILGGAMIISYFEPESMSESYVTASKTSLDAAAKKTLGELAMILRNNPNFEIGLQTYLQSPKNKMQRIKKALLVKRYLVDREGIDEARLKVVAPLQLKEGKDVNKVYFESLTHHVESHY